MGRGTAARRRPSPPPFPKGPRIGDLVHYVLDESAERGDCRPAIVLRELSDGGLSLTVFVEGRGGTMWRPAPRWTEGEPGTWHWAGECPAEENHAS